MFVREFVASDPDWPLAPEGLKLHLALADPPPGKDLVDLADPFLALNERGAFSRALLAEVVGPSGARVARVALKVQSDEYPILSEGELSSLTNRSIEEGWSREIELLELCGSLGAGIPAIVDVLPRRKGNAAHLPPTLFCKARRAFFAAVCPDCGGPLHDVRDGPLLEKENLERFDLSLRRYLGCSGCLSRGRTMFWTLVADGACRPDVGDQADLFGALARLARRPAIQTGPAALPCQGCEGVPTCFPDEDPASGDARRFLTPLTFYDSNCVAVELLSLRFDEFALLLGGSRFEDIFRGISQPGRRVVLDELAPRLAEASPFLFSEDMAGKYGLEVLRLKLVLFRQLCEAVATLHRHTGTAHLNLTPSSVMVEVLERRSGLPTFWNSSVRLLGLANSRPRPIRSAESSDLDLPIYETPHGADPVFGATRFRERALVDQPCLLRPEHVRDHGNGRVVFDGLLESDSFNLATVGERDAVEVTVVQGRPPLSLTFLAYRLEAISPSCLRLRSLPIPVAPAMRSSLDQIVGQALPRARFSVFPCLHVPCDIASLGMMLLAALLLGPGRSAADLARQVEQLARRLEERGDVGGAATGLDSGEDILSDLLREEQETGFFRRANLFSYPERHAEAARAVPLALWREALAVGLRAATNLRGFSICRDPSDFDPAHPEVKVEFLTQLVRALIRRVDSELFGLPGRDREIRRAISEVAAELGLVVDQDAAAGLETSSPEDTSTRTRIAHAGTRG